MDRAILSHDDRYYLNQAITCWNVCTHLLGRRTEAGRVAELVVGRGVVLFLLVHGGERGEQRRLRRRRQRPLRGVRGCRGRLSRLNRGGRRRVGGTTEIG